MYVAIAYVLCTCHFPKQNTQSLLIRIYQLKIDVFETSSLSHSNRFIDMKCMFKSTLTLTPQKAETENFEFVLHTSDTCLCCY